uniref:Axonemal dynein intermediate chain 3 n=1 Tax=Halisarca dujardinii TaxID=2583056 RepID=A0A9F1U414_HALDU|nr:axonemal dynein intermediate chain 3 [Halisarca dujardinii]
MPEPDNQEEDPQVNSPPAGCKAIFVSGPSQQIFSCVADTDVTDENPYKFITKEAFFEDFRTRAAISDFHPVKKQIQAYEEEELLLVYDREYTYGENFYICLTVAAKELILNPPRPEGEEAKEGEQGEEDEIELPKTPEPKEWVCLGSDLEIRENVVTDSRDRIQYTLSKQRKLFNGPYLFGDRNAGAQDEHYVSVKSIEDENFELRRMEVDHSVQAVPAVVEQSCQTDCVRPFAKAVQYEPRLMDQRTSKEVMGSHSMGTFVATAYEKFAAALQQNDICNIFVDDYQELSETDGIAVDKTDNAIKEYQSFTDLNFSKEKKITWIDWHPTIKGIVAVSCGVNYSFSERVDLTSKLILSHHLIIIWSFADPIHPVLFLEAPDDILCFHFNPYKPNFIVGGCSNGQVVMWDIAEHEDRFQYSKPMKHSDTKGNIAAQALFSTDPKLDHAPFVHHCVLSNIESGHHKPINDIQWLAPQIEIDTKTGDTISKNITEEQPECQQLVTASVDGMVLFWDLRPPPPKPGAKPADPNLLPHLQLNLTWKPFLKVHLPRTDFPGEFAALQIALREHHNLPLYREPGPDITRRGKKKANNADESSPSDTFFVGTEDGEVVYATWALVKDSESGKMIAQRPLYHFNWHSGPVTCMERSPFFKDIVLSVGGWSFALWKEGCETCPILRSGNSAIQLKGGVWSPTRPGVFFIIKENGNIDVWDLLEKSHEPSHSQNISSHPLTAITPVAFSYKHHLLAVGDQVGTLHVLEVPWSVRQPSSSEYHVMESLFEREAKRVAFASERAAKRKAEKESETPTIEQTRDSALDDTEEDVSKKDYVTYLSMENTLLITLGLREASKAEED